MEKEVFYMYRTGEKASHIRAERVFVSLQSPGFYMPKRKKVQKFHIKFLDSNKKTSFTDCSVETAGNGRMILQNSL